MIWGAKSASGVPKVTEQRLARVLAGTLPLNSLSPDPWKFYQATTAALLSVSPQGVSNLLGEQKHANKWPTTAEHSYCAICHLDVLILCYKRISFRHVSCMIHLSLIKVNGIYQRARQLTSDLTCDCEMGGPLKLRLYLHSHLRVTNCAATKKRNVLNYPLFECSWHFMVFNKY